MEHTITKPEGRRIGWNCTCGKRFTTELQAEAHIIDMAERMFTGGVAEDAIPVKPYRELGKPSVVVEEVDTTNTVIHKPVIIKEKRVSEVDQLELDMIRLSEIKKQLDELEPLKKEYDEVRQAVLFGMQAQKSKRTEPINGYFAVRSERKSVTVTSPQLVEEWLKSNDFNVEEYKRLDTTMIKSLAEDRMKQDGEYIPGIDVSISESVTVREAK